MRLVSETLVRLLLQLRRDMLAILERGEEPPLTPFWAMALNFPLSLQRGISKSLLKRMIVSFFCSCFSYVVSLITDTFFRSASKFTHVFAILSY